jgi:tRNA A-37 threonylcarbamoyl transferase component Bud32
MTGKGIEIKEKMNLTKYNYYPPKNPQFFFKRNEFERFQKFYTPYSLKSKLFWRLYKKYRIIRNRFTINEKDIPLPITIIKRLINIKEAHYFYNLGSKGKEQKATIVAVGKKQEKFLKYAQSSITKELVKNETKILLQLGNHKMVSPKVLDYGSDSSKAYLITEVIRGRKVTEIELSEKILNLILKITNSFPLRSNGYITAFSHGDFCPWNMLAIKNKELVLIDWEMAGYKPLGYDLFTFICQTNFLLHSQISPQKIIKEQQNFIEYYFEKFEIKNWDLYLMLFVEIKISEESKKKNTKMLSKYKNLLKYND